MGRARAESIADCFKRIGVKLVVAGVLAADIVRNAIRLLKPYGVDVPSGVKAGPGIKGPTKVQAFVWSIREMDREVA